MNSNLNSRPSVGGKRTGRIGQREDRSAFTDYGDHEDEQSSHTGGQIGEFYSMFEDTIKDISSSVSSVKDVATNLLKQYPFYALLGALAVGFAAGTALKSSRQSH